MTNPNVRLAVKTLAAFDAAIAADGGNLFRQKLKEVLPHMHDMYRQEHDEFRSHLGASVIGRECPRATYYSWRWFGKENFPSRMLRLFNRGHMEEGRLIALLLMIGVQVYQQDDKGEQFKFSHAGGHIGGSGDGVGVGIPDLIPGTACLFEFKTYNDKLFAKLKDGGVKEAKGQHYAQMQINMEKLELPITIYFAVNKNDDDIYAEIVVLNRYHADEFLNLGESIVFAKEPPDQLSRSPGFWKCKFCEFKKVCHELPGAVIARNCRTCTQSEPLPSGEWLCKLTGQFLTKADQIAACGEYSPL